MLLLYFIYGELLTYLLRTRWKLTKIHRRLMLKTELINNIMEID